MYSFPNFNCSIVPCPVLTVASWPAYRFHRKQVRWSGIPISCRIFHSVVSHTVKGLSIVNEAEEYVFLDFSCFFYDPTDVGNLITFAHHLPKAGQMNPHRHAISLPLISPSSSFSTFNHISKMLPSDLGSSLDHPSLTTHPYSKLLLLCICRIIISLPPGVTIPFSVP